MAGPTRALAVRTVSTSAASSVAPVRSGQVVFRRDLHFNGIKVFSATVFEARARLGDEVTAWIAAHPGIVIVDTTVTQSSDAAFHCVAITIAYWQHIAER